MSVNLHKSDESAAFSFRFALIAGLFQLLILFFYFVGADYGDGVAVASGAGSATTMGFYYPMFQDVHIMIFIGFGFLMTFLRMYGMSAVGYNFFLSVLALQWAILCVDFFHRIWAGHDFNKSLHLDVVSLISGDFGAGACMISFGAVLGKANLIQLTVMIFLELIFYAFNETLLVIEVQVVDMGGSMLVHMFGAFFGVGVSCIVSPAAGKNHNQETSTRTSDTFAMIGSVFLWCFWPSFNGILAAGDQQHRVVVNTVLALCGSCVSSFIASGLLRNTRRFSAVDIQNATLAGGVAVGSSSDLVIGPGAAILTGLVAGSMCVIGYTKIQPWLASKGLHDTCGVMNLHGLAGIIGGLGGAISSAVVSDTVYGQQVGSIFPARGPPPAGKGRSAGGQAAMQLVGVICSFVIPLIGGLITGFVMKQPIFLPGSSGEDLFDDAKFWEIEEDLDGQTTIVSVLPGPPPKINNFTHPAPPAPGV